MWWSVKKFILVSISILLGFFTYKLPIVNQIFNYKTSFDLSAFYLMILLYFFTKPVDKDKASDSQEEEASDEDDQEQEDLYEN
ncbi:hypothetical protein KO561_15815 [Radiobacillus kanasensis]|uniref:hypothetical protein n=1 Tax=Radiobacillus kanasensis TaxID=2844358 RepID=UPI001E4B0081|nr:hypothetical protein [Radiobacillus kanasensis]UFT98646.1 hypothetical protein KO561_15815 [Radiobacillus kanasensis]